jgi:hypothetical protein
MDCVKRRESEKKNLYILVTSDRRFILLSLGPSLLESPVSDTDGLNSSSGANSTGPDERRRINRITGQQLQQSRAEKAQQ